MTDQGVRELQSRWERLAQDDPLWAILTDREKKGGGWDRDAFFRTGETEIEAVMAYADTVSPGLARGSALDFGCGVGRLTQALARRFERVTGLDIAPTMIELARRYDTSGGGCEYMVNAADDLSLLADASFDFVYSNITLQHVRPELSRRYIRELVRVLKPEGLLLFQLPSRRARSLRSALTGLLPARLRWRRAGGMEMHAIPEREVIELLEAAGARVIDVQPDAAAGTGWEGRRYATRTRYQ